MSGDVSSKGRRNTVRHGRHSIGEEQEESEAWPQMHKHSKSICSVKLRSRGDEGDVPFEVFHESSTQAKNLKRDVTLVTPGGTGEHDNKALTRLALGIMMRVTWVTRVTSLLRFFRMHTATSPKTPKVTSPSSPSSPMSRKPPNMVRKEVMEVTARDDAFQVFCMHRDTSKKSPNLPSRAVAPKESLISKSNQASNDAMNALDGPLPTVHEELSLQAQQEELASTCVVGGADVEHYSPEGIAYCEEHLPCEDMPSEATMTREQFMGIVERIAAVWPGGCTVHVDPPGETLQEHGRRREQQRRRWHIVWRGLRGIGEEHCGSAARVSCRTWDSMSGCPCFLPVPLLRYQREHQASVPPLRTHKTVVAG